MPSTSFYSERGERGVIQARGRVRSESNFSETGSASSLARVSGTVRTDDEGRVIQTAARIIASDFNFDAGAGSTLVIEAFRLLDKSQTTISEAVRAAGEGDAIQSDLNVQALRPVLRKLFMCRAIGDGFGAIVDSLISALENNHGVPLELDRLRALDRVLQALKQEPFMSFEKATQNIEGFERAGFATEPPGIEELADWLTIEN